MGKLLSVSIAAYNVQEYIRECIESCLIPEIMEKLELLVIDDGATDNTGIIADEYAYKYPEIVRVIHKKNGGYGTAVNCGMKEANGKYFKLLDGDDWFDKEGLVRLVHQLEDTSSELIVTKKRIINSNGTEIMSPQPPYFSYAPSTIEINNISKIFFSRMWEITCATSILKQYPFTIPGGISYTDGIFAKKILYHVNKIDFMDCYVYCYRVGRDEQTISLSSRRKHYDDSLQVQKWILDDYGKNRDVNLPKCIITNIASIYCGGIKNCFLFPACQEKYLYIKDCEKKLKSMYPELYKEAFRVSKYVKILRLTHYAAYWPLAKKGINKWYA